MARRRGEDSGRPPKTDVQSILGGEDASLLDIVDNVLSKGVVLTGDVTIGLAGVDLVYLRLSLLLCAADRVLPTEESDVVARDRRRQAARLNHKSQAINQQ